MKNGKIFLFSLSLFCIVFLAFTLSCTFLANLAHTNPNDPDSPSYAGNTNSASSGGSSLSSGSSVSAVASTGASSSSSLSTTITTNFGEITNFLITTNYTTNGTNYTTNETFTPETNVITNTGLHFLTGCNFSLIRPEIGSLKRNNLPCPWKKPERLDLEHPGSLFI